MYLILKFKEQPIYLLGNAVGIFYFHSCLVCKSCYLPDLYT